MLFVGCNNKNDTIILEKPEMDFSNINVQLYITKLENGYKVNHPMGPEKVYCSRLKTDQEKYNKALKYIWKLTQLTEPIILQKKERIPEITKRRNGYSVKVGNTKAKYFVTKGETLDTLYKQALEYLNNVKLSKSKVKRLNVNGEAPICLL